MNTLTGIACQAICWSTLARICNPCVICKSKIIKKPHFTVKAPWYIEAYNFRTFYMPN